MTVVCGGLKVASCKSDHGQARVQGSVRSNSQRLVIVKQYISADNAVGTKLREGQVWVGFML